MKRYLYTASAESVYGSQTFYIDAESQKQANERASRHDTDGIYEEMLEVQGLGDFEPCGDTDLSDFGDFPPDAPSAKALTARVTELEAEVQEQARRNGIGSEREARLLARVGKLEAELMRYRDQAERRRK